jgi:hypothetical protein
MQILLNTVNQFGYEVSATFGIPRPAAEAILASRLNEHGITHDRVLLEWLKSLPDTDDHIVVPKDSPQEERLTYVVADLIAQQALQQRALPAFCRDEDFLTWN